MLVKRIGKFMVFLLIMWSIRSESKVTTVNISTATAKLVYLSEPYTSESWEAGPTRYKAATNLNASATVNWVDIAPYLEPYHFAQGFVDLLLTIEMRKVSPSINTPQWYMINDTDNARDTDIRAYGDGIFYDLLDQNFKNFNGNIFNTNAESGQFVVLRFALPREIKSYYRIFIGKGSLIVETSTAGDKYSDSLQVKLYLRPVPAKLFPRPDILGVPFMYDKNRFIAQVYVNTEVTFDAGKSVNLSSGSIVEYGWAFNYSTSTPLDQAIPNPKINHTYNTLGLKKVVLSLVNEFNAIAISSGDPFNADLAVDKTVSTLPLWVNVISPLAQQEIKLYPPAPHPFIYSRYPEIYIKYELPSTNQVLLKIYSFNGDLVKTLVDGKTKPAGQWVIGWNGTNEDNNPVAAGIYFCQLQVDQTKLIEKIVLVK